MEQIRGIRATTAFVGLEWVTTARSGGKVVQRAPSGYAFPVETMFVEPREYARFVTASARPAVRALSASRAVLSVTSAQLRGGASRIRLRSQARAVEIRAAVRDTATQGYEVLRPRAQAHDGALRFVLIDAARHLEPRQIRRIVRRVVGDERPLEVATRAQTKFLRHATDGVRPYMYIKRRFGEFAARAVPGSPQLQLDPAWIDANIRTEHVPILGSVTCHRGLFPQLRRALRQAQHRGLSGTVDVSDYAGCYNARFVAAAVGARISRHTWGIALDINARSNPYGAPPSMDRRLVRVMERWGFVWGGRWLVPDGMHFEWFRDPRAL